MQVNNSINNPIHNTVNDTLLATIIDVHQASISRLADAWADLGASAFYLTDQANKVLIQWPPFPPARHATFAAPIFINGQPVGKLHVCGTHTTVAQLRLATDAQMVSDILQLEYELERMTTDIIDQQDQLMALHQLAQITRVHHDLKRPLIALAQITAHLLKTEYAFIALQREQQPPLLAGHPQENWSEEWSNALLKLFENGGTKQQWLFHQHDSLLASLNSSMRNLLIKRIPVRPGTYLLLGAANKIDGDFQAPDLKLFSTIAEPAAASLENAILHQEMVDQTRIQTEMDLARQVQMHLLPQHTPSLPGIELAAQSRPASHVGGDFYDFITSNEQILTLTLGDVSGKGMPAALLMAMLRTVLRGKALEMHKPAPEQLLGNTNEYLYSDFSEVDMFATLFVAQYDYRCHRLYYANDGHAPVIYRPAHQPAYLLVADSPPLGVLPMNLAEQHSLEFQPGDLLVITSDGFSEAENNAGEMFGYDRLLELVDTLATASAATIIHTMFATITAFTGDHAQSDDQTLLVFKRIKADVPSF
jgi:phosphoserine phosphatase RsbU/P